VQPGEEAKEKRIVNTEDWISQMVKRYRIYYAWMLKGMINNELLY
jgi:hypothetical protein